MGTSKTAHCDFDIAYIGEALVAKLLKKPEIQNNLRKILQEGNSRLKLPESIATAANVSIGNKSDPMHRIDVLLTDTKNGDMPPIAIEVKFGASIDTPGKYCKRYLSKGDKNNQGNMIPKLASGNLTVESGRKKVKIQCYWILLVRTTEIKNKLTPEKNRLGKKNRQLWEEMCANCSIISLEDLLQGVEGVEDTFEQTVKECVTPQETRYYHVAWGIKLSENADARSNSRPLPRRR